MPSASLLSGLRALVAALDREGQRGEGHGGRREPHEEDIPHRQLPGSAGERGGSPGSGKAVDSKACCSQRPVVSLRAVAIALVAAQRLAKLAAYRAARRGSSRVATGAGTPPTGDVPTDETYGSLGAARGGGGGGGGARDPERRQGDYTGRCPLTPPPACRRGSDSLPPTTSLGSRRGCENGVIPLGPAGSGGVPLLDAADVRVPSAPALAEGVASAVACAWSPLRTGWGAWASGRDASASADDTAAAQCLEILDVLVAAGGSRMGRTLRGGFGIEGMDGSPTLLQVLAAGQVGHWRRLEERGLVSSRRGSCGVPGGGGGGTRSQSLAGGASRVIASRHAR